MNNNLNNLAVTSTKNYRTNSVIGGVKRIIYDGRPAVSIESPKGLHYPVRVLAGIKPYPNPRRHFMRCKIPSSNFVLIKIDKVLGPKQIEHHGIHSIEQLLSVVAACNFGRGVAFRCNHGKKSIRAYLAICQESI